MNKSHSEISFWNLVQEEVSFWNLVLKSHTRRSLVMKTVSIDCTHGICKSWSLIFVVFVLSFHFVITLESLHLASLLKSLCLPANPQVCWFYISMSSFFNLTVNSFFLLHLHSQKLLDFNKFASLTATFNCHFLLASQSKGPRTWNRPVSPGYSVKWFPWCGDECVPMTTIWVFVPVVIRKLFKFFDFPTDQYERGKRGET